MKKIKLCAVSAFVILALCGCKEKADTAASGRTRVAVSVFPVYDIVRNICGDRADVFFSVPAGADPHTFEPRPSIALALQKASLFIGVTPGLDGWMERYLHPGAARGYIMEAPRRGAPEENPHIWLSVREAKKIAAAAARLLCGADAANCGYYRGNLASYDKKLNQLDKTIAGLFMNKSKRSFIQWHEAWDYFAADYGLTIAGTVQREGSDRSSVRSLGGIVERARRDGVTAIVVSLSSENRSAAVLAGEIKGTIVGLDGIGDPGAEDRSDYLKLMYFNAKTLAGALH
jgi:zinc transport system substrate-binding protein